jgi:glycosyltransferase involved in cell wall biosynthesis
MKVLIQNRPDAFKVMGGDTIQMMKTAYYLKKLGVSVDISLESTPKLDSYDIVHLMNLTRVKYTYAQLINAKKQKKKVVLSPIYWSTHPAISAYIKNPFFDFNYSDLLRELVKNYAYRLAHGKLLFDEMYELIYNKRLCLAVLEKVDCILPNSQKELDILKKDFPKVFEVENKKIFIVPNGVSAEIFKNPSPEHFIKKYGLRDFVLHVGRFGYRKNQLSLIRALKGLGINVVFIGNVPHSSGHYDIKNAIDMLYYQKCRKEADSSMIFLNAFPHHELASAYAACKVLALPSLYETPGLVALEAALCGANICITKEGSAQEYFQDLAFYCDPYNLASIREAVLLAYNSPKNDVLKKHILENFTWDKVAKKTLEAYEKVLQDD